MVGKGDIKNSRIFHQSYVKCCKLQNLTPLNNVMPSSNGRVLDFCVDRIKYVDWPPILNALSCDLSLHSVAIRCRQQVKTVLEQIDCERLAKTVNKRAVILTKFMLSNLVEAVAQLLADTTLLTSLLLEGLPLRIPYLNPICEVLQSNNSLSHLALPRCLIGDAGCLAICKAVRCLPNILTLDLSGCELTMLGASYIADLIKYQKINRYSENWVHTLRYRLPQLDSMAGLRRLSLCGNPLGDAGAAALLSVLSDDLWIKAVDLQGCEASESTAAAALLSLQSNTTLVVLDLRHNGVSADSLAAVRAALRKNETNVGEQYPWLGNTSMCSGDGIRLVKPIASRNGVSKDRTVLSQKNMPVKYASSKPTVTKREKDYSEMLEQQLQEEISHRQQLEELNSQLVEQMKQLQQQQQRRWRDNAASSESEQSLEVSARSGSSGSSCSVPIDQSTLSYIQQAFRDIYTFIKNNQCEGNCQHETANDDHIHVVEEPTVQERANMCPKKAQSTHVKMTETVKVEKITKSAHLLGHIQHIREAMQMSPKMIEKHMGDTKNNNEDLYLDEVHELNCSMKSKKGSMGSRSSGSLESDSARTLVSPRPAPASAHAQAPAPAAACDLNPREALYSSSDEDSS